MPDPTTLTEWFVMGSELLSEAKRLLPSEGRDRGLKRLTSQSAECFLKGLQQEHCSDYKGISDRHDLASLLDKVVEAYPTMKVTGGHIELLQSVRYQAEDAEGETSCSTSAQTFYNPDIVADSSDTEARVRAAEAVARMAKEAAQVPP